MDTYIICENKLTLIFRDFNTQWELYIATFEPFVNSSLKYAQIHAYLTYPSH